MTTQLSALDGLSMRHLLALMLTVGCSSIAHGHQDMVIEFLRDGELCGLPAAYEPASLVIPRGDSQGDENVVLRIGNHRIEFPECLSILFKKANRRQIGVSASWYHEPTILPYYISIQLPTRGRSKHGTFDGWSILVELDTAKLIRVEAEFESNGGYAQRGQRVDVGAFCTSDEVVQLVPQIVTPDPPVSEP